MGPADSISKKEFVLVVTTRSVRVARFNQPRRFRVCIAGAKPARDGIGANVVTEHTRSSSPWATAARSIPARSRWGHQRRLWTDPNRG